MVHAVTVVLSVVGVVGMALVVGLTIVGLLALARVRGPLERLQSAVRGYELWLAFAIAMASTAGSLFFTGFADFYAGEIGWYERVCMYPLSVLTLLAALAADRRAARYLLTFPIVGFSVAAYGLLLENGVVDQPQSCVVSGPGGCATKWIDEFGFVTIPLLSMTAFALIFAFLLLAAFGGEAAARTMTPSRRIAAVAVGVGALAAVAVGIAVADAATAHHAGAAVTATAPATGPTGNVVRGKAIFKANGCASCHTLAAAGAKGRIAKPDLGKLKLTYATIVNVVTKGFGSTMSPYKNILTAGQIKDVATFVYRAEHP